LELLEFTYEYNERELINKIVNGALSHWTTILTPHLYEYLDDFQITVNFHEDNLVALDTNRNFFPNPNRDSTAWTPYQNFHTSRVNSVRWSLGTINPQFPKDDSNVSPQGTPEDKGACPCQHCGSSKHWDPKCKYTIKGTCKVRANLAQINDETENTAQEDYNKLFYRLVSDNEAENSQDFCSPLQSNLDDQGSSRLGGESTNVNDKTDLDDIIMPQTFRVTTGNNWEDNLKISSNPSLKTGNDRLSVTRPALNRQSW
jgi:hypothetical protein